MCTDGDVVLFASSHRLLHYQRITSMEAASDIRMIDQWNELVVGPAFVVTVGLTQIDVDFDAAFEGRHAGSDSWTKTCVMTWRLGT